MRLLNISYFHGLFPFLPPGKYVLMCFVHFWLGYVFLFSYILKAAFVSYLGFEYLLTICSLTFDSTMSFDDEVILLIWLNIATPRSQGILNLNFVLQVILEG